MSDREILELILNKVTSTDSKVDSLESKVDSLEVRISSLEDRMSSVENNVITLNQQLKKSTAELKAMDDLLLDEIERVHSILDKHKENRSVHTA